MRINSIEELEKTSAGLTEARASVKMRVLVCAGPGCLAVGAEAVAEALSAEIAKLGDDAHAEVELTGTGCHGFCEQGPLVTFEPAGILYRKVKVEDASEIVETTVAGGETIERLLYHDPESKNAIEHYRDIPFYAGQCKTVLENVGRIDPRLIEESLAAGGYASLGRVLSTLAPEEVIDAVEHSGLRGRGGAGFPTGRKWRLCAEAEGEPTYVLCNGDEGDPGAFMDRCLFEGDPHRIIEGMIIGAYAIGADEGFIYIRDEYPLAVRNTALALDHARERGLLGNNILGSGFSFDLQIVRGGGAFVCGEETALMASVMGGAGEPVPRPPYPAVSGLWGKPTNINNVETWANVPVIIRDGADAYAAAGTEGSKGTKVFCLVGKVRNTGLIEVPMGVTLREIIDGIGGGVDGGRTFKAIQTGGPSGGCIPESLLDLPVDFDELWQAGSIMGSGGMIVMDDRTCMVDVARYFTRFLADESCGKCVPCREGLRQMAILLEKVTCGEASEADLDLIEALGEGMREGSLCGLGRTAANPVLSTLRHFRDEYIAHVVDRFCPAGVCRDLVAYSIDEEPCTGCGLCPKVCPVDAIAGKKKKPHRIDSDKCIQCGSCFDVCKFDAVLIRPRGEGL